MRRRCVVCGKKSAKNAADCDYYYPRNEKEAQIWQLSMDASGTSLDDIQKCCCVCIEHVPQFVERARQQAENKYGQYEKEVEPIKSQNSVMERPSVNVLLLPGVATAPCHSEKSNENDNAKTSQEAEDSLDKEIYVKKSSYPFCTAPLADIDETEVTVLRTPMYTDEEHNKECGDNNCTDVLVLGRKNDKCTCKCEQCSNTKLNTNDLHKIHYNLPPIGSECDTKMVQELTQVIKKQQERIYELETLVDRQNNRHLILQSKMNELYKEFGRMERPEQQSNRTRILAGTNVQWYSQRVPLTDHSETDITKNFLNSGVNTIVQPDSEVF